MLFKNRKFVLIGVLRLLYFQWCNGAGTRGNGVPKPFSRFALK